MYWLYKFVILQVLIYKKHCSLSGKVGQLRSKRCTVGLSILLVYVCYTLFESIVNEQHWRILLLFSLIICIWNNNLLCESNKFLDFRNSPFPGNFGSIWWYFEKCRIFSENPKVTNTAQSQTPRKLTLRGVDH